MFFYGGRQGMQIKKDYIRDSIISVAQDEFIDKGYLDASMRSIAKTVGVSVSNVYNYFSNKDKLFSCIVKPVCDTIDIALNDMEQKNNLTDNGNMYLDLHDEDIEKLSEFIDRNRNILKLLVFKSYGSSYEKYKEDLTERYTELSLIYLGRAEAVEGHINCRISGFCLHNIASMLFNMVTEILMHDVSYNDMVIFIKEMLVFISRGYEGIKQCSLIEE